MQKACRILRIEALRDSQERAIDAVGRRKDCAVFLPTGAGKSACFQIPALAMNSVVVVVSPLIALMKDQVEELRAKRVDAIFICGENKTESLAAIRRKQPEIVYLSPEQAVSGDVLEALQKLWRNVCLLAIDEV